MRYIVEIFYKGNTIDKITYSSYSEVLHIIDLVKLLPTYKEIRVYKLTGHYKNEDIEIQHNN